MNSFKRTTLLTFLLIIPYFRSTATSTADSTLTLLFVGDVMGHGSQIKCATQPNGTYSYKRVLSEVKDIFGLADITIANLEVPLAGEPYAGYPSFSSPDELAIDLNAAGADVLVTVNNHAMDKGVNGLKRTIKALDRLNIAHTGTATSQVDRDKSTPLFLKYNGITIGLISYTSTMNGNPRIAKYLANMADTAQIRADYNAAISGGANEVVAFMHWGEEYERTENLYQQQLASWMHRLGIRIIVGSHPHVIQPMYFTADSDSTYGQLTAYSLGNFVSNQRWQYSDGGMLIMVRLSKNKGKIELTNAGCFPIWVDAPKTNGVKDFRVIPIYKAEALGYKFRDGNGDFDTFSLDTRTMLTKQCKGFDEIRYDVFLKQWILPWHSCFKPLIPKPTTNLVPSETKELVAPKRN